MPIYATKTDKTQDSSGNFPFYSRVDL